MLSHFLLNACQLSFSVDHNVADDDSLVLKYSTFTSLRALILVYNVGTTMSRRTLVYQRNSQSTFKSNGGNHKLVTGSPEISF